MANSVCISGQLLILDLIEKVEPYGKFVNINTDGIFMWAKDEEDYKKIQEIAKEWENRTGLELEWERYTKMYQRDVNNYICVEDTGAITSKGCVKKKSPVDNDLPIVTEALIEYCVNGTPVEDTINNCNELIKFQKIVQVTRLYQGAFYGTVKKETIKEKGKDKEVTMVDKGEHLRERVLRVFASTREEDMGVYKIKNKYKVEKIANTPDRCFIDNENIVGVECPEYLDKQYYIDLAKDTLKDFLGQNDEPKEVEISKEQQVINILNKNYPHFYDVLEDIKLNTKVTKTILEKYITIDVFKQYGTAGKLLEYYRIWSLFYNKKSYKGLTLTKNNIDSPIIRSIMEKYSNYNAEKDNYTKLDSKAILYELFNVINVEDVHISKKLLTEFDLFSDVTLTDNTVDENVLFILAVNETKNPSIVAYNVKYGTVNFFKIPKAVFSILPLYRTDFIYAKSFEQLSKPIVIGKDQEGINLIGEHPTDKEWWINNYKVLIRDYDKYGSEE